VAISHTVAFPVSSNAALIVCAIARTQSDASITRWRGSRSAHTPPKRTKRINGTVCAASTMPRSVTDPVRSSTANASATGTSRSPIAEMA
jgi:hypothetical protein